MASIARRVAAITGGGTGVGAAIARQLASSLFDVVIFYNSSREAAESIVESVTACGARALALQMNVTDDVSVKAGIAATLSHFGRLDLLVNNAGITQLIPFSDLEGATDAIWQSIMDINVIGAFRASRAAASALAASGGGCIVNISSIGARNAQGTCLPYSCSKAALDALTAGLARALAPAGTRVLGVAPGFIDGTPLLAGLLGPGYEASRDAYAAATPLGRVCTADDVAAAVASLVLGSTMVTGVTMVVDGGFLLGPSRPLLQQQ